MDETDEPQGLERTHSILDTNQSSLGVVIYITSKLRSTLEQHMTIAHGKKRIDCRLSYSFYTTYYDSVEVKKVDYEYTCTTPIAILIRYIVSFDNAHFFAQLRHPVSWNNVADIYIKRHSDNVILSSYYQ